MFPSLLCRPVPVLNWMRVATGSQCSDGRKGEVWINMGRLNIRLTTVRDVARMLEILK